MKSVTMISWELDPFHTRGGTAYAIRRLADQLMELRIQTRVLLPDWLDTYPGKDLPPFADADTFEDASRTPSRPSRAAISVSSVVLRSKQSKRLVPTQDQMPSLLIASKARCSSFGEAEGHLVSRQSFGFTVFTTLRINDFSKDQRQPLPYRSLLACAVTMADIVVTSAGILKDAREFEWPESLKELQKALTIASAENRVLTVESMGCLPEVPKDFT